MRARDFRGGSIRKVPSITFDVTTAEVQNFLQGKVTALMAAANNPRPIKVGVSAYRASAPTRRGKDGRTSDQVELFPFIITLPESVMVRERQDQQIDKVFLGDNQTNKLHLIPGIDKLLRSYQYTKYDMGFLNSASGRRFYNLPAKAVLEMKKYRFPKLIDGGDGTRGVAQLLDPIKVFHDFFTDKNNPNERFFSNIVGVRKINDGLYVYSISRELIKSKNKNDADDLNNHVRSQLEKMAED